MNLVPPCGVDIVQYEALLTTKARNSAGTSLYSCLPAGMLITLIVKITSKSVKG